MKRLLLLVALAIAPALRAAAPPADTATVQMSPFEVQANSVEFRRWIKVGSPNFIVYTDGSSADASRALKEMEMLHAAAQRFFGRRSLKLTPVTVILPTSSSDWRKLEAKGEVEWKVAVSSQADEISELLVVQYDWQDNGIWIVRAAQASCEARRLHLRGPFWFSRGLHSFFETAEFDKDGVGLGRVNPRSWSLVHSKWLPWGRFFQVSGNSPEFTKEDLVHQYQAQATIFTHFCFTNPDRAWVGRLTSWLDYLNAGHAATESEFKAIFTQDWKTWQRTMEQYVEGGKYNIYTVKVPPESVRFTETKFPLPVREMRDLFVLTQILVQSVPASEASLSAMLYHGLKTESLRELLVGACVKWKRKDAALENLRKLIAAGSKNPRVYTLAAMLLTDESAPRIDIDARVGPEVAEARAWCRQALEIEPLFPDANMMLAFLEALAPEVDQQGIAAIEGLYLRTKDRMPTDDVMSALAIALWRAGDLETARELSAKLKTDALSSKQSREIAAALLARISATAPSPANKASRPVSTP